MISLGVFQDVRPGDVRGHQVGGELNPLEANIEDLRDRADHQGFRQAGNADQENVPLREDRREDEVDHLALADDHLVEFGDHHIARMSEFVEKLRDPFAGV